MRVDELADELDGLGGRLLLAQALQVEVPSGHRLEAEPEPDRAVGHQEVGDVLLHAEVAAEVAVLAHSDLARVDLALHRLGQLLHVCALKESQRALPGDRRAVRVEQLPVDALLVVRHPELVFTEHPPGPLAPARFAGFGDLRLRHGFAGRGSSRLLGWHAGRPTSGRNIVRDRGQGSTLGEHLHAWWDKGARLAGRKGALRSFCTN